MVAIADGAREWRYISQLRPCKYDVCHVPEAEERLLEELSLSPETAVEEMLAAVSDPQWWYANTDKGERPTQTKVRQ
jgi:hypothetical protein